MILSCISLTMSCITQMQAEIFVIKVSPDDYSFLINNQGKIYCAMSREVNIDIVEDVTLERNQCMIETNTGIFNCSLDIELNKLINNIKLLSCTG